MKGLALAIVGLWVVLQTTKGPLAEKIGLIASSGTGSSSTPVPDPGQQFTGPSTPLPAPSSPPAGPFGLTPGAAGRF